MKSQMKLNDDRLSHSTAKVSFPWNLHTATLASLHQPMEEYILYRDACERLLPRECALFCSRESETDREIEKRRCHFIHTLHFQRVAQFREFSISWRSHLKPATLLPSLAWPLQTNCAEEERERRQGRKKWRKIFFLTFVGGIKK